jgi:hypothetical protein
MHDHNIRQEIKLTIEGDRLHQQACAIAVIELANRRKPRVEVWDLTRRSAFLRFSDYPGLPDLVYSKPIDRFAKETYVGEIETHATNYSYSKKLTQFRQKGVTDVIIIDLRKFEGNPDNWVELGSFISERLP